MGGKEPGRLARAAWREAGRAARGHAWCGEPVSYGVTLAATSSMTMAPIEALARSVAEAGAAPAGAARTVPLFFQAVVPVTPAVAVCACPARGGCGGDTWAPCVDSRRLERQDSLCLWTCSQRSHLQKTSSPASADNHHPCITIARGSGL